MAPYSCIQQYETKVVDLELRNEVLLKETEDLRKRLHNAEKHIMCMGKSLKLQKALVTVRTPYLLCLRLSSLF